MISTTSRPTSGPRSAGWLGAALVAFASGRGQAVGYWRSLWILGRKVVLATAEAGGSWTYVLGEACLVWRLLVVVGIDSSLVEVQGLERQREGTVSSLAVFLHTLDVRRQQCEGLGSGPSICWFSSADYPDLFLTWIYRSFSPVSWNFQHVLIHI